MLILRLLSEIAAAIVRTICAESSTDADAHKVAAALYAQSEVHLEWFSLPGEEVLLLPNGCFLVITGSSTPRLTEQQFAKHVTRLLGEISEVAERF